MIDGERVIERLRGLPGGPQVLRLAALRDDVEVVGGAVRDLALGSVPREIDLVLDGSPASFPHASALFARELALLFGAEEQPQVSAHERFGTAALRWSGGRIDVAARRSERYPERGALPEVGPGDEDADLRRRDFTVNAIVVGLGGARRGIVRAVPHAPQDLQDGRLRVLHRDSFIDDPTRLLRLGRYAARLGFEIEPRTATLARQAIAQGALSAVSAARIGAELRLAVNEPSLVATLQALSQIGVLAALTPPLPLDAGLLEDALTLLPPDGKPSLLALGALLMKAASPDSRESLALTLEGWELPAARRRSVTEAATRAPTLSAQIAVASTPSQLWDLLYGVPVEAVALAGALGTTQARTAAQRWLTQLRDVRLQISGDDLLAAGVQPGPEVGERLQHALRRRLDGSIDGSREAELQAALDS